MEIALRLAPVCLCAVLAACSGPDVNGQVGPYDSGGELMPEQASYDVAYYDLDIEVSPSDSTIEGHLTVQARAGSPLEWFVLDLVPELEVRGTEIMDQGMLVPAGHERLGGKLWIKPLRTVQPEEMVVVRVAYGGRPRVAPNAPWDGGFSWDTTSTGSPWIATSCQGEGADLWWPVKDHVSDEPDSMSIRVTVPDPLVVAANGRLRGTESVTGGRTKYDWFVSDPINTYAVALNIAPYRLIEGELASVAGDTFPVQFFVLAEDYEKGAEFFPEIIDHVRWFEANFGPYPFRADKYGVAQTPHLGMEHQSIIAYGADFNPMSFIARDFGFDQLHHHELAHEWWGNLVTNADWKDAWIHEGFGTYTQALYAEDLGGEEAYHAYMDANRGMIANRLAVAPEEISSVNEMFERPHDIYTKGAWILHTLRYLIGRDALMQSLRTMAYPNREEESEPGCRCRFASTDDFIGVAEEISGRELDWFFDVYVRQPALPELVVDRTDAGVELSWKAPDGLPFMMPIDMVVDGER
ncbi:MAG: M1 family metallopeptidase, partial [Rhodothermales bacterium]|nr:M1 family metallopeptidase [Rhodothermales bacterium]